MKKYLFLFPAMLWAFIGCNDGGEDDDNTLYEYVITAYYVYANRTSSDITVKSYSPKDDGSHGKDSIFVIPKGGDHKIRFYGIAGVPQPLNFGGGELDSTIVTNGEKQIIFRYRDGEYKESGKLYFSAHYEKIEDAKTQKTFRYAFTDADFVHAEPVKP